MLVVVPLLALALHGCGSGTQTNGLERLSAAEVQQRAAAALKSAKSVHFSGKSAGGRASVDVRIQGASSVGTLITAAGRRLAVTRVADATYIKASRLALKALGAPAALSRGGADRWIKLRPQDLTSLRGFSAQDVATQLTRYDMPVKSSVQQAKLDGEQVVVIRNRDGSKLYVANTGAAYPLRGEFKGPDAGRLDFTEYGADFHITAPVHAISLSKFVDRR
jgi:hypothetical protein